MEIIPQLPPAMEIILQPPVAATDPFHLWLPVIFAGLMGLSILIYVILDGYDLGIGLLLPFAGPAERDRMISAIGPFWDANETWLVLAVGLLLVAFPVAHGVILSTLYVPVVVLLVGLILRGVSFEFRLKVADRHKRIWNTLFATGSLMATAAQGFMLGLYLTGLEWRPEAVWFSTITALCLVGAYAYMGAAWLVLKSGEDLQQRAIDWARIGLVALAAGLVVISVATPLVSQRLFEQWFAWPELLLLAPLPLVAAWLLWVLWQTLARPDLATGRRQWLPIAGGAALFLIGFLGLAYSFMPYVVPERLTLHQSAAAPESLAIILVGTLVVLPVIVGYSVLSYWIFRGKATDLKYY